MYDISVAPRHFVFTFVSADEEAGDSMVSQTDRLTAALAHVLPPLGHEVIDFAGHWENLAEDWQRLARYLPAAFAKLDPTKLRCTATTASGAVGLGITNADKLKMSDLRKRAVTQGLSSFRALEGTAPDDAADVDAETSCSEGWKKIQQARGHVAASCWCASMAQGGCHVSGGGSRFWVGGEMALKSPLRGCDQAVADSACFGFPVPPRCAGHAPATCPLLPPS